MSPLEWSCHSTSVKRDRPYSRPRLSRPILIYSSKRARYRYPTTVTPTLVHVSAVRALAGSWRGSPVVREEPNKVLHDGEFSQYFGFLMILMISTFTLSPVFTYDQGRGWVRGVDPGRHEKCADRNARRSGLDVGVRRIFRVRLNRDH